MEHELAVNSQAVERYFLGEMTPEEKEDFEAHYFVCDLCAADVKAASIFIENSKSVFQERQFGAKKSSSWLGWLRPMLSYSPAYAALAMVCLIGAGYERFRVVPALKAPQSLGPGVILEGNTRSALPKMHEGDSTVFHMPWDRGGPAYVELRKDAHVISSGPVKAPPHDQPLDVYIPGELEPGRYSLVVRALDSGRPGPEVMEGDFDVVPPETNAAR